MRHDDYPKILDRRAFAKGQTICKEGDDALMAYVIQFGKVRIFQERDGKKIELSILKTGDIFGEMALIENSKRTASVEAIEDCNVIVIKKDIFEEKFKKSDATIRAVIHMLSSRVLRSNAEIMKSKGVNLDNFISLLNQLFVDLLAAMPDEDKAQFKAEAFPVLGQMIDTLEKYRDKL